MYSKSYYNVEITELYKNVLCIRYLESCIIWEPWIRQARGTLVYFDGTRFIILRQLLERGYELNMIKNTEEPELDIKPKFNKISYPSSMEQSVDSLNLLIENKDLKTEDDIYQLK